MCSGIINNQPCNITAILPTRVVVYGVEERGVGDDIVKVKRSTTVAAAARPPPVTTARNWLRTTRTWTPGSGLQCDGVMLLPFFLCFSSLPGVCWWARVSSHIEILQCLHSGARGQWAPTSLETGERLRLSASLRLSLVSSLSLLSLPGYGTGPTQYLLLINFNWNPQMKYCPIQQLPGTDHFNTARHTSPAFSW